MEKIITIPGTSVRNVNLPKAIIASDVVLNEKGSMAMLRVAVDQGYDAQGKKKESVFHNVILYAAKGETLKEEQKSLLKKGAVVSIKGFRGVYTTTKDDKTYENKFVGTLEIKLAEPEQEISCRIYSEPKRFGDKNQHVEFRAGHYNGSDNPTDFFDVKAFNCALTLKKGDDIIIKGDERSDPRVTEDGKKFENRYISAWSVEMNEPVKLVLGEDGKYVPFVDTTDDMPL